MVLFGTGGETHGGSLWRITLHDLINGDIDKVHVVFLVCVDAFRPSQHFKSCRDVFSGSTLVAMTKNILNSYQRATCIKELIWPLLGPKTEICFSPISSDSFFIRMTHV